MNKTQQQIRDYFFSQKDEICTHLKHLMEIKSISDDRKKVAVKRRCGM